jgi:hypothetical protein
MSVILSLWLILQLLVCPVSYADSLSIWSGGMSIT